MSNAIYFRLTHAAESYCPYIYIYLFASPEMVIRKRCCIESFNGSIYQRGLSNSKNVSFILGRVAMEHSKSCTALQVKSYNTLNGALFKLYCASSRVIDLGPVLGSSQCHSKSYISFRVVSSGLYRDIAEVSSHSQLEQTASLYIKT